MSKEKIPEWMKRNAEAREKEMRELRSFVLLEDGSVNWDGIRERYFEKMGNSLVPKRSWTGSTRHMSTTKGDDEDVWRILWDEGILSPDKKGNYLILGANVLLNPWVNIVPLYFTREEDAKAYVELEYGGAMYEVEIIKCGVIKTKKRRS